MHTQTFRAGDQSGRLFARDGLALTADAIARAVHDFRDAEDGAREPLLRAVLREPLVQVDGHFGIDPRDILHVYLQTKRGPLFACVIATEDRVAAMLDQTLVVSETFAFQVASGRRITKASAVAALESWAQRDFPDCSPRFAFGLWVDEPRYHVDLIEVGIGVGASAPEPRQPVTPAAGPQERFKNVTLTLRPWGLPATPMPNAAFTRPLEI